MQFTYKLYILYINFINIYKSTSYTCIVYLKNHTLTIQKLYITILAVIKHAPRHTKAIFSLLIYVGAMTNQKKIIKISNGNECVGSGYPVGGVAPLRGRLQWKTGRQESTSLYYTYNIKYLHLSGLLPSVSSCVLHTEHTGNMKQDDNTLLVQLLLYSLPASCVVNLLSV